VIWDPLGNDMTLPIILRHLSLTILLGYMGIQAGEIPPSAYLASSIPADLMKGVQAVIRHEEISFDVLSVKRAEYKVRRIITILKPEGKDFGVVSLLYDKYMSVTQLKGTIYDSEGHEIRNLEKGDIEDSPATSVYSLYDDNRIKTASLYHGMAPYTVDISYTLRFNGYLGWPTWYPEEKYASVEYSGFTVSLPAQLNLRYWTRRVEEPRVMAENSRRVYTWEKKALPPFEEEPLASPDIDQRMSVTIAPEKFEMDGFPGDLNSWKSFGQWYQRLAAGRQELPAEVKREVGELLKGVAGRRDTIRALYYYLQKHTRYVSIQLGIGGWQPFDAAYVHQRGYGDCKALSNFMMALLHSVGISSSCALIFNGRFGVNDLKNFPSQQFNHMVLCVPLESDTIWLECTSQSVPFNHLGSSNENRYALLILPDGGYLVPTVVSKSLDNRQIRHMTVTLDRRGNAAAEVMTVYTGNQNDRVRNTLLDATPRERDDWLHDDVDLPAFSVQSADYSGVLPRVPEGTLRFNLVVPHYASTMGKRMIFNPNLLERRSYIPKSLTNRKSAIRFVYQYIDDDSVRILFPSDYTIEAYPKPVDLRTDFGNFSSAITLLNDSTLLYTRHVEHNSLELPPEKYGEYRDYVAKIVQADKAVASIIKKP